MDPPFGIHQNSHANAPLTYQNLKIRILSRLADGPDRKINEFMYIRDQRPTLNTQTFSWPLAPGGWSMLPVTQTACMKLNILSSTSFCIIPSLAYVSVNRAVDFFHSYMHRYTCKYCTNSDRYRYRCICIDINVIIVIYSAAYIAYPYKFVSICRWATVQNVL